MALFKPNQLDGGTRDGSGCGKESTDAGVNNAVFLYSNRTYLPIKKAAIRPIPVFLTGAFPAKTEKVKPFTLTESEASSA